jgi:hypothetical protein
MSARIRPAAPAAPCARLSTVADQHLAPHRTRVHAHEILERLLEEHDAEISNLRSVTTARPLSAVTTAATRDSGPDLMTPPDSPAYPMRASLPAKQARPGQSHHRAD